MLASALVLGFTACSDDDNGDDQSDAFPSSFYLLNEGGWSKNNASLDYYDAESETYIQDVFTENNPEITLGLGDVGNDLKIYGSKLYAVINNSNKVEVMSAKDGKVVKTLQIPQCRYIAFHGKYIYISSWDSEGTEKLQGKVFKIDTASLDVSQATWVEVGRAPEELAVVGSKLYVANSGGNTWPADFDNRVSVIDLSAFKVSHDFEVAHNLHRLRPDGRGNLYVSSRGDYENEAAGLHVVSLSSETVTKSFDLAVANLSIAGNKAYIIATVYEGESSNSSLHQINTQSQELLEESVITDGTGSAITNPYGIFAHPATGDIYITHVPVDYLTPGTVYCYSSAGKRKAKYTAGIAPAHFAFLP